MLNYSPAFGFGQEFSFLCTPSSNPSILGEGGWSVNWSPGEKESGPAMRTRHDGGGRP